MNHSRKSLSKFDFVILSIFSAFVLLLVYKVATIDPAKQSSTQDPYGYGHVSVKRTCTCRRYVNGNYVGDIQVAVGARCGDGTCL